MKRSLSINRYHLILSAIVFLMAVAGCNLKTAPAGKFMMGSPDGEYGHRANEAQHEVTLTNDFEIMATEVTWADFKILMGYDPSYFSKKLPNPGKPVENVSWYDALAYANAKSLKKGLKPAYVITNAVCDDGTAVADCMDCKTHGGIKTADISLNGVSSVYQAEGYRLPTEAEWEYAARAGTTSPVYNGEISVPGCEGDSVLEKIAWYCANSNTFTHNVGLKAPNSWGLYDMSGNVEEWCWDNYGDYEGDMINPAGPSSGYFKVVRGGSVRFDGSTRLRSAYREGFTPNYRCRYIGFRLVKTVKPSTVAVSDIVLKSMAPPSFELKANIPDYPKALPFSFTRADEGLPLTDAEIKAFTKKITGLWKDTHYFEWMYLTSNGMDESNPYGMPWYKAHLQDFSAEKQGDTVIFHHGGGSDNLWIRSGKMLNNVIAGYLATGDPLLGKIAESYCRGMEAFFKGEEYSANDPERTIMPRCIFTQNHEYTVLGRKVRVDYDPVKAEGEKYDWNAHTIPNHVNPYYGDIWIRNMRSKDDVPHIYRMVPMMMRLAREGKDESVRVAAEKAVAYLQAFGRDIVDSGYYIRQKDNEGNTLITFEEDNPWLVKDLSSFVNFEILVPNAECNAKMTSALLGYQDPLCNDCGSGTINLYDMVAGQIHYYNMAIVVYFHQAALTNALMNNQNAMALELLQGMSDRMDAMMMGKGKPTKETCPDWEPDLATHLLVAASSGLPLKSSEARLIASEYSKAADHYITWPNWDLWSPAVPNGYVSYIPGNSPTPDTRVVGADELAYLLEYCYSPLKNKTGAKVCDCDVVLNPALWGE
jgi:formylglycine-generating enzyme required for sulfatase activity